MFASPAPPGREHSFQLLTHPQLPGLSLTCALVPMAPAGFSKFPHKTPHCGSGFFQLRGEFASIPFLSGQRLAQLSHLASHAAEPTRGAKHLGFQPLPSAF